VARGAALQDILFPYGVEFPCGGRGRCRRCRVRVTAGHVSAAGQDHILTAEEIAAGYRLACRARADGDATLEIAQWDTVILADDSAFAFTPQEGLGVAVDLGTTTLVAQLLDLATARVLGVRVALNPQVAHGADIMSRVEFALQGGAARLAEAVRVEVGNLVSGLGARAPIARIHVVGNTVMHHLFCGIDVEPLSHYPFEPVRDGLEIFRASELGWRMDGDPEVRFLPCLGGFVGSDILAGLLATRMTASAELIALLDLGTNGEIAVGNREGICCASMAAGPAFEGGRISMGMRAATGAIAEVRAVNGRLECHTLGGGEPRGLCGSGLVDAVAAGLELGLIAPSGRLTGGAKVLEIGGPVRLVQSDIRELQLAKAATAAGMEIVLSRRGVKREDLHRIYLAGAFGNYLNRASARRIGLIDFPLEGIEPAGNTALLGAKLSLFSDLPRPRVIHVPLGADAEFQDRYVAAMGF
jgi:uncharacterized 2Fe-2S/4Fe-4S cluster protein (DUF4445 family)